MFVEFPGITWQQHTITDPMPSNSIPENDYLYVSRMVYQDNVYPGFKSSAKFFIIHNYDTEITSQHGEIATVDSSYHHEWIPHTVGEPLPPHSFIGGMISNSIFLSNSLFV